MSLSPTGTLRHLLLRLHESDTVPDSQVLSAVLDAARKSLSEEDPGLRPRDSAGRPGGLILLKPGITTVAVPDLHARTDYMASLVDMSVAGEPLLQGLLAGRLQVVCVGDGLHSEARGADRWRRAWEEYEEGFRRHEAMDEEMREGLSLMAMVMMLKTAAPDGFHFLKGNHENIANDWAGGNRPFGKYAWEGRMVKDWFLTFLGEDMLLRWADFEASLPLLAVGDHFLISHAEPRRVYGREDLIGYRDDDRLIFDFTWTDNGEAEEGCVDAMLRLYLGHAASQALYFGGHRPVRGLYGTRASGRYVQIHNPDLHVVAVLYAGDPPDPDRDIRTIREMRE